MTQEITQAGISRGGISSVGISTVGITGDDELNFLLRLPATTSLTPIEGKLPINFTRPSPAYVFDFEGLPRLVKTGEAAFCGARRVENLVVNPSTPSTQDITVEVGKSYQARIGADSTNGATVTFSGAFTGVLTADGANDISFVDGLPETATTTTLTCTIAGDIKNFQVEGATDQANQNPSEFVDGVQYFITENGNTVDGSGIITGATGSNIDPQILKGIQLEEERENLATYSNDFTNVVWLKTSSGTGIDPIITENYGFYGDFPTTRIQFDKGAGTTTADRSLVTQNITVPDPHHSAVRIYAKLNSGSATIIFRGTSIDTHVLTTEWQPIEQVKFDVPSTQMRNQFGVRGTYGSTDTADILVCAAQMEDKRFLSSPILSVATSETRNATKLDLAKENIVNDFALRLEFTPLADGEDYINGLSEGRLFSTTDLRGTANEVRTQFGGSYDVFFNIGGGNVIFQIDEVDIVKDETAGWTFAAEQQGYNVLARIFKDGVKKYEEVLPDHVLDHSNQDFIEIGRFDEVLVACGCYKNIGILSGKFTDSELEVLSLGDQFFFI